MLDKTYDPSIEAKWLKAWKEAGLFSSSPSGPRENRFVVVIPPPNVTGVLHVGHALNNALQDVLVRARRLEGRRVCWVPGTDHGGIATQNVMEKQLKAEKLGRRELGRELFLERMRAWAAECKKTILGQLERLGCSLDFEREAFTLDAERAAAVLAAFKTLWEQDLLYRGERMVNWCVRCGTALSDIEVEHEERRGKLWRIRYPLEGSAGGFLTVATTRPETLLADTAVAVHPEDDRYKNLIGAALRLPLLGRLIPVIADAHVEAGFGTGALKVTPAHDPKDYEIWQRHKEALGPPPRAIGYDGRMTEAAGPYKGLSREEARKRVLADLAAAGLLEKEEEHAHAVGTCSRCLQAIEPLLSEQWFLRMEGLARGALKALESGGFSLHPRSWEGPYRVWLEGIRDWCLSRQIWWGHRLPVWYCVSCQGERVELGFPSASGDIETRSAREWLKRGVEPGRLDEASVLRVRGRMEGGDAGVCVADAEPGPCPACGGSRWLRDRDVLDTWFSSALWPFSVFGWPKETEDLRFYYPTSVLVTGYEILHLWVARMQMLGLHFLGEPPFAHALIHGIVRDKKGKKMSKSLGNVVDPVEMMDKYGTDALRFALVSQAHPGKDIPFDEESLKGPRNFANKLWNSSRFVLMNLGEPLEALPALADLPREALRLEDRWILSRLQSMLARTRSALGAYEFAAAAAEPYAFLWDEFCDWYVELAKPRLAEGGETARICRSILVRVLSATLKALHPFMPFITEELHAALKPHSRESAAFLLESGWPDVRDFADPRAEEEMGILMRAVRQVRAARAQLNVPPGAKLGAFYRGEGIQESVLLGRVELVKTLARLSAIEKASTAPPEGSATVAAGELVFFLPVAGVVDLGRELKRLEKEVERLGAELALCEGRLGDAAFASRAPRAEVERLRLRARELRAQRESLEGMLEHLRVREL